MDKEQIITVVTRKTGLYRRQVENCIDAFLNTISDTLVDGGKVKIVNFGNFEAVKRAPRTGRNPKAGVPVHIPACTAPVFKASKPLKDAVNNGGKKCSNMK